MRTIGSFSRRAFTLVELLVVMAIIMILMGLLMPAVMNARNAARTSTCLGAQKNITTAILTYHHSRLHLPFYGRDFGGNQCASWCSQILTELGHGKLAKDTEVLNRDKNQTPSVREFKCPSGNPATKGISYVLNVGRLDSIASTSVPTKAQLADGLFFYGFSDKTCNAYVRKTISSIKDGTSNTLMLSESLQVTGNVLYDGMQLAGDTSFTPTTDWRFPELKTNTNQTVVKKYLGVMWESGATANADPSTLSRFFPRSRHSGTVNVAFADGSAKSVSRQIYYQTFIRFMSPDDKNSSYKTKFNVTYTKDPNYQ